MSCVSPLLSKERPDGRDGTESGREGMRRDMEDAPTSVRAAMRGKDARADGYRMEFDKDVVFEDEGHEQRKTKTLKPMVQASKREREQHATSGHVLYRPWCDICVRGAGNLRGHCCREEPIGDVPEIHLDYTFSRDIKDDAESKVTVLAGKDRKSGGYLAHVVPRKGASGGWMAKQLIRDFHKFGHRTKLMLRSD